VLDLLAEGKESLDLKEDPDKGVYVKDLRLVPVKTVAEINALAVLGRKSRKVGSTLMNRDSSRSHCLFCIMIEISEMGADGENHIRAGKLNMVDCQ
jgi:kinesin family protein 3/17